MNIIVLLGYSVHFGVQIYWHALRVKDPVCMAWLLLWLYAFTTSARHRRLLGTQVPPEFTNRLCLNVMRCGFLYSKLNSWLAAGG